MPVATAKPHDHVPDAVPDDASLDDFAPTDDTSTDEGTDPSPATVTTDWSPDGSRCTNCDSRVDRRWASDDGPVCADCKEW